MPNKWNRQVRELPSVADGESRLKKTKVIWKIWFRTKVEIAHVMENTVLRKAWNTMHSSNSTKWEKTNNTTICSRKSQSTLYIQKNIYSKVTLFLGKEAK